MDDNFFVNIGPEDHIIFKSTLAVHFVRDGVAVGKIISCSSAETIVVQIYHPMTSEFLQHYSLPPITRVAFAVASQGHMQELVAQDSFVDVMRASIIDIAYVVPLAELESGLFHMCGASNSFFIRYSLSNGTPENYMSGYYFVSRAAEPLSMRLFHSLNYLAGLLRKSMYHQGEAETSCRTFRLFFSIEAFSYLRRKIGGVSIMLTAARKQSITMYYDTLSMECRSNVITKSMIRVVTKQGLHSLKNILGVGIGLGLTKRKPTKRQPLAYCSVGSYLTSVELDEEVPFDLIHNFNQKYRGNAVEFLYTEESRQLSCSVRYSKIIVNTADAATSRIPTAVVRTDVIAGAYISANFLYNGHIMTVHQINNGIARCRYMSDDADSSDGEHWQFLDLPLDQVQALVACFGR